jgi:hypothetical protein
MHSSCHMPDVLNSACDIVYLELLSTKSKQEGTSFHCGYYVSRNLDYCLEERFIF